jgi:hypothetical protein
LAGAATGALWEAAMSNKRWMAEIFYNDGCTTTLHTFEELHELHDLVEMGPDWNTIEHIVITLNLTSVGPSREAPR